MSLKSYYSCPPTAPLFEITCETYSLFTCSHCVSFSITIMQVDFYSMEVFTIFLLFIFQILSAISSKRNMDLMRSSIPLCVDTVTVYYDLLMQVRRFS